MVKVRKAIIHDASQVVAVMKNAEESGFMLFSPGERKVSAEAFAKYIESINSNSKSGLFVATDNEQIIGYMIVQNEKPQRIAHRGYIVIGVHSESRGKGVGKALFSYVLEWAKQVGLHRLDLTVIATNEVAVKLYKKMGFEIEGVKRDSLFIDGEYVDEYYMSILL
ncbi:GNAT family N-acetyltransferase [Lederbergia citri]|uniref:GNAT family N-acetyltransferase n=1 Tax=Lederbergia citri TaxID=2833580 RepID=A0A942TCC5_9BACI|nr:GNAT family N-acetyltransferase [Lederbergia citri]MBS4195085.1 GNAT family N-acetyltransferase [Lederbergia citri]